MYKIVFIFLLSGFVFILLNEDGPKVDNPIYVSEMIKVPVGSFKPRVFTGGKGVYKKDAVKTIHIKAPLYVGKYEVTRGQWKQCYDDAGCSYMPDDIWNMGLDSPIVDINYVDVQEYITWLNQKTGMAYRLPTEIEWEYFARGGDNVPFGSVEKSLTGDVTKDWYLAYNNTKVYPRPTKAKGWYGQNGFGIADVRGNVWEWTDSCWDGKGSFVSSYGDKAYDKKCISRITRGEYFTHMLYVVRTELVGGCGGSLPPANLGFRLVRN